MKCPRCSAGITTAPDPGGIVTCAGCGARLRTTRAAAPQPVAAGVAKSAAAAPPPPRVSPMPNPTDIESMLSRLDADESVDDLNPSTTLPPGTPLPTIPRPQERKRNPGEDTAKVTRPVAAPAPPIPAAPVASSGVTLDMLLEEIRAVQATQDQILEILRTRPSSSPALPSMSEGASLGFPDIEAPEAPTTTSPATPVRSRRRKTVILIDDDAASRDAAVAALVTAEVPVRAVASGNDGLAAIAESKPDVIVMELGIGGDMGGKDVVNMIKATMEWVDIPIILYTRLPIESQKEARTIHGADEFVLKSAGPEALVARVITVFRKG